MYDKVKLKQNLRDFADSVIYNRGAEYWRAGRVLEIDAHQSSDDEFCIIGSVSGTNVYEVELIFKKGEFILSDCTCPYGDICKHTVAVGLSFIETQDNNGQLFKIEYNYNIENYYIEIGSRYGSFQFNLHHKSGEYRKENISDILKNAKNLTPSQRELLVSIKMANHEGRHTSYDYEKIFTLLKEAKIPVYRDDCSSWERYKKYQVKFDLDPPKIKAVLEDRQEYDEYRDYTHHRFVFILEPRFINYEYELSFHNSYIFHFNRRKLQVHKVGRSIVKIVKEAYEKSIYYRYSYKKDKEIKLETELTKAQTICINKIIKEGRKYLDLETNLSPDYDITEYKQADATLVVDYDAAEGNLHIKPMVDYGCLMVDIAETVFVSTRRGQQFINRRQDFYHPGVKIIVFDNKEIRHATVFEDIEKSLFMDLRGRFGFSGASKLKLKGQKVVFEFYEQCWTALEKHCQAKGYKIQFTQDNFNFISGDFEVKMKVDMDAANDWLGFDVDCYCGADKLSIEDLRLFIEQGGDFLALKDGRLLRITNREELERFMMMLESFQAREEGGFEGKLYHAPELEYIITSSKYYNAKLKKSFTKFIKEAQSGKPVESIKLSRSFDKILRDYQKKGIDWFYFLRKYRFAGILADDMGLGKTVQTLALLEKEKVERKPSIVICPKTLLYNWQAEAQKFIPQFRTIVIDGSQKERQELIKKANNYDLIITGYSSVKKDENIYKEQKIVFNYAVLDEAQFIKNHATKNAQVVKKINADYRLALTGTPLENSVSEVWSIFDFLMPGFLGSYKSFTKKFHNPIMKQSDMHVLKDLHKKVECFMLRRTKKEVLPQLPPKVEQSSLCHLNKAQNLLYQEILTRVKRDIFNTVETKGFNSSRIHIFAGLTKLRQVCNHPVLLLKDKNYEKYESAKLEMFNELVLEIVNNKKKVLVFSQFTKMLDILSSELEKRQIKYSYLTGKTKKRQEVVDEFNTDTEKSVFLISIKAGGTGLNLTSAQNVIIFDPWWNPSVENQAIDRAHRIGQENSVNVYRFITSGTIEEKIVALQEKKKYLFDNLVGESADLFKKLTWDDVKELFR